MTDRKRLTYRQKCELLAEHALCPSCGEPYGGHVEFDHVQALCLMGADVAGNLQPLCRSCHAKKTASDAGKRAKADRQGGRTGQQARRAARTAAGDARGALPGTKRSRFKRRLGPDGPYTEDR